MRLLLGGRSLTIAQVGPDFLVLEVPQKLPADVGEVVLRVDGHEDRFPVRLPEGADPAVVRTRFLEAK